MEEYFTIDFNQQIIHLFESFFTEFKKHKYLQKVRDQRMILKLLTLLKSPSSEPTRNTSTISSSLSLNDLASLENFQPKETWTKRLSLKLTRNRRESYSSTIEEFSDVSILNHRSSDIAKAFLKVEFMAFCRVEWIEFQSTGWLKETDSKKIKPNKTSWDPPCPNLLFCISRFNQTSEWTTRLILESSSNQRVKIIEKLIRIVQKSYTLQNFQTVVAITLGLQSEKVSKLKEWRMVRDAEYNQLRDMIDFCSPLKNFKNMRSQMKDDLVPFLGLILQDLVYLNQISDLTDGLINVSKFRTVASLLCQIERYKQTKHDFKVKANIFHLVSNLQ